ncbi:MAG TPA: hydrogenase 4 subunit F, partial [Gammaproteobacteria bacterium]|nr:hydrogenase 4 subunit F [Gammaproteobacteria bacterium]
MFELITSVLWVPIVAAALLALLPGYRVTARLNMLASFLTLAAALALCAASRSGAGTSPGAVHGTYLFIDDLNIVFLVLNCFVGFTTSVFSAGYIGRELQTGKLDPAYLRFYHAMYQLLMFAMNLALVAD